MDGSELFLVDVTSRTRVSYGQLQSDVEAIDCVPIVYRLDSYYDLFKTLLAAIRDGAAIALAHEGVSAETFAECFGNHACTSDDEFKPTSYSEGVRLPPNGGEEWLESQCKIGIFTSGSAGRPRLVWHSMDTLTRGVRTGPHHADDVWGLAYHPTHFAGLQVFFQAVANRNPLIRLSGLDDRAVHDQIREHGMTHISATPTFLKLLCSSEVVHPRVQRVTTGGEMARPALVEQMQRMFPRAKILNIYASTEVGALLISDGENFRVPEVYRELVKIVDGQLAVHESLLADSVRSLAVDGYYMTGDCVQVLSESPLIFRIESRTSDIINVGGYKVNPHDVERLLLARDEVADARVYGLANSVTGKIVCCDVVARAGMEIDKRELRRSLEAVLQPYQIPRIVNVVRQIETTSSGKIVR